MTIRLLIVVAILILSGCEKRTDYGKCVGLGESQNPSLHYKLSSRNVIVGVIFIELIIPPIIVVTDETYCPMARSGGTI